MNEKNKIIFEYLNNKVKELNNKYKNIIDDEKYEKAKEMFVNRNEDIEILKKEIDSKIEEVIKYYNREVEIEKQPHYDLNDYFDCRVSNNTLHIHVIPKDIREDVFKMRLEYYDYVEEKLEDALSKIPEILELDENDNIHTVMAVSKLLRTNNSQELFKKYGFDVEILREGKFVDMFDGKRIGIATMPREKFLNLYNNKKVK